MVICIQLKGYIIPVFDSVSVITTEHIRFRF
ncbi:hypothetical protein X749_31570 [Mesorhizobium sp. LNJC391B00]|nr:hypothetical protein X749_31570 [Mesorhizobium sp. LNJC391B00]